MGWLWVDDKSHWPGAGHRNGCKKEAGAEAEVEAGSNVREVTFGIGLKGMQFIGLLLGRFDVGFF